MKSYQSEFDKWVRRYKERVYPKLSDVLPDVTPDSKDDVKVGDTIMFTNDYGVTFGPHAVLGFCELWHGRCVYFDHESYWCPARPDQIKLTNMQHDRQEYIYKVAFKEPPIQGDCRTEFFFHSLAAIFDELTPEMVGCKVSRLWNVRVTPEKPYENKLCTITQVPVSRKRRINAPVAADKLREDKLPQEEKQRRNTRNSE